MRDLLGIRKPTRDVEDGRRGIRQGAGRRKAKGSENRYALNGAGLKGRNSSAQGKALGNSYRQIYEALKGRNNQEPNVATTHQYLVAG
jgi:hypothetical protein